MEAARRVGVDALLITHPADVRWLSGFTGSSGAVVLSWGKGSARARLFTDGRYATQAKSEAPGAAVTITMKPPSVAACEWLGSSGAVTCGFDEMQTSVATFEAMRRSLPAPSRRQFFRGTGPLLSRLREVKDAGEVQTMRAAAALGCQLFDHILGFMEPGMTEAMVAAELEYRARLAGAEGMSFETIVASAERSALPHGRASLAKLPRSGFCTLDFGVVLDGYCSDMTRTVHFGRATPEERQVYEAVLEAQEAGSRGRPRRR